MLQPGVFYEYTMQQNVTAAGSPLWTFLGGPYSAPPGLLADFKGAASRWGGEREGRGKEGRRRERGREGRLTLMRNWNRAADWLRPAALSDVEQVDSVSSQMLWL